MRIESRVIELVAERDDWKQIAVDRARKITELADSIEQRDDESPDLCRLCDHMQSLCACRDLANRLRAIAQ